MEQFSIEDLLGFHKVKIPEYAGHVLSKYLVGVAWNEPVYPDNWFAGFWERLAIWCIMKLEEANVKVTTETFTEVIREAGEKVEGTYS